MKRKILRKNEAKSLTPLLFIFFVIAVFITIAQGIFRFLADHKIFFFVGGLIVLAIISFYISRERKKEENYRRFIEDSKRYLLAKSKEHEKTLGIKRNQILRPNDYGHIDKKQKDEWNAEINTFLVSIQFPSPELFPESDALEIIKMVDTHAENASKNLVYDAEKVTPREYELMCADILKDSGWEARVTKGSGDQGVDVVAEKSGKKVVLQCKRYSYPVGNSAVQEVLAGKSFYKADVSAVVSNQTFTPSAKELAQSSGVLLLHHELLSDLESMI